MREGDGREGWSTGERGAFGAMRVPAIAVVVAGCALVIGTAAARLTDPAPPDAGSVPNEVAGVVQRAGPAPAAPLGDLLVVEVSVNACGARGEGTGFVVADGLVVTAAHVVGDAGLVRIDHGPVSLTGEVLGALADRTDLALVAVDTTAIGPVAGAAPPPLGAPITVVGHPAGGPRQVVVGPRVAVPDGVAEVVRGDLVGIDVPLEPGWSGGPALDADGRVVAVVVAAEQATGTAVAVAVAIDDVIDAELVDGSCPATA